jgi:hypothetical protein
MPAARNVSSGVVRRRVRFASALAILVVVGLAEYLIAGGANSVVPRNCVYTGNSIRRLEDFEARIGAKVDCAEVFNTAAETWTEWAHPYFLNDASADTAWARWARSSQGRQLIVTQGLIPLSLAHTPWLLNGGRGAYTNWARAFAENLVHSGLSHAVVRLAPEANGTWEVYSIPRDPTGLGTWILFWRRTVAAMRSVHGAAFTFDWTVNALVRPVNLSSFYPGSAFVDIIGVDAYPLSGSLQSSRKTYSGIDGIRSVADFARSRGKPFSVPEWGAAPGSTDGAVTFMNDVKHALQSVPSAYQSYFYAHQWQDALAPGSGALRTYRQDFGSS